MRVGGEFILEVRKIGEFISTRLLPTFNTTNGYLNDKLLNLDEPVLNDVNTYVPSGSSSYLLPCGVPTSKFLDLPENVTSSLYCGIDRATVALHRCLVFSRFPRPAQTRRQYMMCLAVNGCE